MTGKEAEVHLKNYNMYKRAIKNIDQQIAFIRNTETGVGAIEFDRVSTGKTNKISDPVHDVVSCREQLIKELEDNKKWYELIIQLIDDTLGELNQLDRDIIQMFIIDNRLWIDVAYEVRLSERQCRTRKNNAMKRIASALSGLILPKDCRF